MNEYKPQKIISFAPRQIVVRVSDSICDIWTSSNVYVILAQNSVRSHQSCMDHHLLYKNSFSYANHPPRLDEIDIAFMPDSDNYGGISPVSPNQVPPPFHQADACKILDCPGGRGRTKWLPGVRLSLVPGSFALNIEAVSQMKCYLISLISLRLVALRTVIRNSHSPFFSCSQSEIRNCCRVEHAP